ncbi:MAG: adenylosuccinate lyase [Anaerolineaceae bacterium]|nr:adenylosuccinate lyase [Anaerolineaceae bacterium]
MSEYEVYQSPFSWRYASAEMRRVWGEANKRRIWRQLWVCLAQAQSELGLVDPAQVAELKTHVDDVDITRALEIESKIQHDLMAEVMTFAEQCPTARGIIHLGATSMDIKDNAEVLLMRDALDLILPKIKALLEGFVQLIRAESDTLCMAYTHLQPAEPTTLGYRFAVYAQDLLADWEEIKRIRNNLRGKGFKGAVGTGASYQELIGEAYQGQFEAHMSELLGLPFYTAATQTYPRKQDHQVVSALSGLGITLYKFSFDLRLLQSPPFGELSEPFGKQQVGSSAMPFKRNPIVAESICSLARMLAEMPQVAWQNAAHSLLERTLDDSANRRSLLPEAFLICDEILGKTLQIVQDLQIHRLAIQRNFETYAPFASTERLLMRLVKAGADRQDMHEAIRVHAMRAWERMQQGDTYNLIDQIASDAVFTNILSAERIRAAMSAETYVGNAPQRALEVARTIEEKILLFQ